MGTSGVGSVGHVNGIHFQKVTGTRFRFVPYRGIAPTMQDLVAGQIDMMITSTTDVIPQVRAGTIKAYAVSTDRRVAAPPSTRPDCPDTTRRCGTRSGRRPARPWR
jgi:tripartite-type tricarboxylate transporter receptor subunit TctC